MRLSRTPLADWLAVPCPSCGSPVPSGDPVTVDPDGYRWHAECRQQFILTPSQREAISIAAAKRQHEREAIRQREDALAAERAADDERARMRDLARKRAAERRRNKITKASHTLPATSGKKVLHRRTLGQLDTDPDNF